MTRRKSNGGWRTKWFDVVRELMFAPRTYSDLVELTGLSRKSLGRIIPSAEKAGIVWIERPRRGVGWGTFVIHLCSTPFEKPGTAA